MEEFQRALRKPRVVGQITSGYKQQAHLACSHWKSLNQHDVTLDPSTCAIRSSMPRELPIIFKMVAINRKCIITTHKAQYLSLQLVDTIVSKLQRLTQYFWSPPIRWNQHEIGSAK